jgi:hypothetical protein
MHGSPVPIGHALDGALITCQWTGDLHPRCSTPCHICPIRVTRLGPRLRAGRQLRYLEVTERSHQHDQQKCPLGYRPPRFRRLPEPSLLPLAQVGHKYSQSNRSTVAERTIANRQWPCFFNVRLTSAQFDYNLVKLHYQFPSRAPTPQARENSIWSAPFGAFGHECIRCGYPWTDCGQIRNDDICGYLYHALCPRFDRVCSGVAYGQRAFPPQGSLPNSCPSRYACLIAAFLAALDKAGTLRAAAGLLVSLGRGRGSSELNLGIRSRTM